MRYLHTMVRAQNLTQSLDFYCNKLDLLESHRLENETGRFTLVYLYAPQDEITAQNNETPLLELTYNWDLETYAAGRNFGHIAFAVKDIYAKCQELINHGVILNRPPRDGYMAFLKSPDNISIELLQQGEPLEIMEPWLSMQNHGAW